MAQKFGYNGKELNEELGLQWHDFSARNYDASLGRWMKTDPLAEEREWLSPYNFVQNNPINRIDPDGALDIGVQPPGDYYDENNNYLGNDGINDNKVYQVTGSSKFSINDFKDGGKYHNNQADFNKNNGDGFSVNYKGKVSDVFVTGDTPSDKRVQSLHPAIRMKATNFIKDANVSSGNTLIRMAQGFRTYAEQNALYAKGRTTSGAKVTNAKGGFSNHNFGLAFDIVGITNGKVDYNLNWKSISTIGKSNGFNWGGDWKSFKDKPHFENMFGNSLKNLRALPKDNNGLPILK